MSMLPPTSLPSGDRLRDTCVERLLSDRLSSRVVRELLRTTTYRALLPEAVLQLLGSTVGTPLDRLMRQFLQTSPPNLVHRALVRLRCRLFTTNFDLCLEAAGCKQTWHLHGSIARLGSLQNQLYRLGKTALAEAAQFEKVIDGRALLIVGYSLRDDDIVGLIRSHRPSQLLYLSFNGTIPQALRRLTCNTAVATGSLEALFRLAPPPMPAMPRKMIPLTIRLPALKHRVNALLRICSRAALYDVQLMLLRKYLPRLRGRPKLLAMCELADSLRLAKRYAEAENLARQVIGYPSTRIGPARDAFSTTLVQLGLIALDRGDTDFDRIESLFRQALEVFEELVASEAPGKYDAENDIWRSRIFNNLGLVLAARRDYAASINMYRRSLALKARHHERYGIAQTHANLAKLEICMGQLAAAARLLDLLCQELIELPDAFICSDAVIGCLSALRDTKLLPVIVHDVESVSSRSERWWRSFVRRCGAAPPPVQRILAAVQKLRGLIPRSSAT